MKQILNLILLALILPSCHPAPPKEEQPTVLVSRAEFDLEKVNFQENVPRLYSKHLLDSNDLQIDTAKGNPAKQVSRYKISNVMTDALKINVPQQDFGYLYKSPQLDSVAKFQNIRFGSLQILCQRDKKPVAFYAEAEFKEAKLRKKCLDDLQKKYGKPKYAFFLESGFDVCSYEWVLADRTIQVETSYSVGVRISTDGNSGSIKTYKLDMLIVHNPAKEALYNAHIYEFPDRILYDGKLRNLKELQLQKKSTFKDDFLLHSTNTELIKNVGGIYDIPSSESDQN